MKYRICIFMLTIAFLVSCDSIQPNQNFNISPTKSDEGDSLYKPRPADLPEQILIYCDLTTSIKEEGLVRISEKLKQVLLNIPRESLVTIRLVEKNVLGESPFPELRTLPCPPPDSVVKRELVEAKKKCKEKDEPYIKKVIEITDRIKTLRPHVDVSCIIDTLESAHDFFKGKDKEKYKFRLIYFSDMIEQCNTNSIFICGSKNQPKKTDILSNIEKNFNPRYNLPSVLDNNISVIITTNDNPNYNCLSLSEQKDIWSAIFAKTGYRGLDITTFNYTQEIPDQLRGGGD